MKTKKSGKGDLYTIEKQGAAQIALVGFPNSGKSSLLKTLTNATPVIADYPMSTLIPLAGMMPYEDIQFQIVDLPPIGNETTDGWVSGVLRIADILMLIIDLSDDPVIQAERLTGQLSEWKIPLLRKGEHRDEEKGSPSKPVLLVGNKFDLAGAEDGLKAVQEKYLSILPVAGISIKNKQGIEELRRTLFRDSRIIRVYSKQPGKEPDLSTPFILPAGSSVIQLAALIHKDFISNLKYACIWGSAKFTGQRVQKDHILFDRDVVEFHVK
jgi:hypothetical protein